MYYVKHSTIPNFSLIFGSLTHLATEVLNIFGTLSTLCPWLLNMLQTVVSWQNVAHRRSALCGGSTCCAALESSNPR